MSQRGDIRAKVVANLVAAGTAAGTRVFDSRNDPYTESELPAISVYTPSWTDEESSSAPRTYRRTMQLVIESTVQAASGSAAAADALDEEAQVVMFLDDTLGGLVADVWAVSGSLVRDASGSDDIAMVRSVYSVLYDVDAPEASDRPLDDLKSVEFAVNTDTVGHVTGLET